MGLRFDFVCHSRLYSDTGFFPLFPGKPIDMAGRVVHLLACVGNFFGGILGYQTIQACNG